MRASQRARAGLAACLVLGIAALGLVIRPASAASVTVTLGVNGPSPANAAVTKGDIVVFHNGDSVAHTVKASSNNWSYNVQIPAGGSTSHVFGTAGTFKYADTHVVLVRTQVDPGSVVVSAPKPSPTPTAKPTAKPTPKPTVKPTAAPTATATPKGTLTPTPSPTSSSGTAVLPGLGTGQIPPPTPGRTALPQPNVAPPAGSSASPAAAGVRYAQRGLTQESAHRYGLPAALALVAVTGMVSLLVRLLLAEPAARRRRTGLDRT